MFRRCVSIFALTASFTFFALATIRVGFDLYQRNFTREEVLLLVGILIAALIAFLIGKVTQSGGGTSGNSATRFSKHIKERACLTCEYWHGDRVPEPRSRNVVTRSDSSRGPCIHGGGKTPKKAGTPPCESYETWRLLA